MNPLGYGASQSYGNMESCQDGVGINGPVRIQLGRHRAALTNHDQIMRHEFITHYTLAPQT